MVPPNPFAGVWGDLSTPICARRDPTGDLTEAAALLRRAIEWVVDIRPGHGDEYDFGLRTLAMLIVSQNLKASRVACHFRLPPRRRVQLAALIRELRATPLEIGGLG